MKRRLCSAATMACVLIPVALTGQAAHATAGGLAAQDLDHGTTAAAMVSSLLGPGVTASNITYTGANIAAGTFSGGASSVGFGSGVVLGSGRVQTIDPAATCSKGVEGPNQCSYNSTDNGTPGDANLTALAGVATHDASVLEFDFTPQFSSISFQYVFSSDEYLEFANTSYNDTFAFLVNGTNCATLPGTATPVSINTVNNTQNPSYYRDNSSSSPAIDTEMDGLTTVLTCSATVNAGVPNHIKLAIADGYDHAIDSNVFLAGGSFVSGTQIPTSLSGGGQSGTAITVPTNTSVTDQATLTGTQAASATGTLTYGAYSDAACTALVSSAGSKTVSNGSVPASDPVTLGTAGTYFWSAVYSGDASNNAAQSCDETETVTAPVTHTTSTSYTGATTGTYSDPLALSGQLLDTTASGPLTGQTLSFAVGSVPQQLTATGGPTDGSGNATATLPQLLLDAGSVPVQVSFAGATGYHPSTGSATLIINPDDCQLAYTGDTLVPPLTNTALSAQLTDPDPTQGDLSGHTVTFNVSDSASPPTTTQYTALTNAAGVASTSVPLNADSYAVGVSFAGDSKYAACGSVPGTGDTPVTVTAAANKTTGGGWSSQSTGRFNFGFNLIPQTDGSYKGQLQTRSNSNKNNFHGRTVTTATQLAPNKESWTGSGTYNGQTGATFTITVVDSGSGTNSADTISLTIKNAAGQTLFTTSGPVPLKGGNITIH